MWKNMSLKAQFIGIICLVILVFIGTLSLVLISMVDEYQSEQSETFIASLMAEQNQEEQLLRQGLSQKVASLAALLAQTGSSLIMDYNFDSLQRLAENVTHDPDVVFVTFYGEDESPLTREPEQRQDIETIRQDIVSQDALVGVVEIGVSFTSVHNAVNELSERIETLVQNTNTARAESVQTFMLRILVIGAIGVVVLSVVIYGSFSHVITKPLLMIADVTHRLAEGDLSADIDGGQRGEVGILAHALREMKARLHEVLQETDELIRAAQAGQLHIRGNAEAYRGSWRDLVGGMNNVIEAFVTPMTVMATSIDQIAQGESPEKITEDYQGDFHEIKEDVNSFIDAMQVVTQVAETLAEGDLTANVRTRSDRDILMQALNTMTRRLNTVVSDVTSAAAHVATGSRQMSSGAEEMSQGATEQAASAEEVSSSMEEMAANIRQNADNALQTERIAVQSAEDARDSGQAVAEAVTAMKAIAKQITIIEEIARQTHMLSLNATIEAAKAEEHGKGFAVVASEVRGLAERSRLAAEEITELADSGVAVAEGAGEKLDRLVPNIQRTAELVQEISAASGEQHSGAEQINRAIQQLDQIIQHNAANSEEMASTAEELAGQAEHLQHTIAFFTIDATVRHTLTSDAEPRVRLAEKSDHKNVEVGKVIAANILAGPVIDMERNGHDGDERDAEFERY